MKNALVLIVAFFALYFSASATTYKVNGQQVDETTLVKMIEAKFQDLLQEHRLSLGLNSLSVNNVIVVSSRQHVTNLTRFDLEVLLDQPRLSHSVAHENYQARFDQMVKTLKKEKKFKPIGGGEITSLGHAIFKDFKGNIDITGTAEGILRGLLNSPAHKEIIESPYVPGAYYGAGIVIVGNKTILACNFIDFKVLN